MAAKSKHRLRKFARRRTSLPSKRRRTSRTRENSFVAREEGNFEYVTPPNPVVNVNPIFHVSLSNGTSSIRTSGLMFRNPNTELLLVSLFNQDPASSHTVTLSILDWQNPSDPSEYAKFAFLGGELLNPPEEENQGGTLGEHVTSEDISGESMQGEANEESLEGVEAVGEEYTGEHMQGEEYTEAYIQRETAEENSHAADTPEEGTDRNGEETGSGTVSPITTPFTFTIPPRQLLLIHAHPPMMEVPSAPMYEILFTLPVDSTVSPILVNAWGINENGRIQEGNTVLHQQFAPAFPPP
ncbi:hypothetical protein [Brevibacillus migulae]|uniref:hypothetical protein n=1 Tax=Brevibacillus migulae TaxID=1644114 RepID=UPI00106DF156|nr:hypothetical protein [Brevibacillus migulae]